MSPDILIALYCLLIFTAAMAGGWIPTVIRMTHLRMQVMMTLVAGMMTGVALLHLIPQAMEYLQNIHWVTISMLIGLLSMLFLLRFFHVHHHDESGECHAESHARSHDHDHDDRLPVNDAATPDAHEFSWVALFIGLVIHTILDGIALAASVRAEARHENAPAILGFGMFLAVVLHKPLDAMSITSLMRAGGWSRPNLLMASFGFAVTCPIGILLLWFGTTEAGGGSDTIIGCALGFSAGAFLCIALTDLVPEALQHSHDRLKLSAALWLGAILAVLIELMPGHEHGDEPHDHNKMKMDVPGDRGN